MGVRHLLLWRTWRNFSCPGLWPGVFGSMPSVRIFSWRGDAGVLPGSGLAATHLARGGYGHQRCSWDSVATTDLAGGGGGRQRRADGGADRAGAICPEFQFAASARLLTIRVSTRRRRVGRRRIVRSFGYKRFAVIIADRPGFFRRSSDLAVSPQVEVLVSPIVVCAGGASGHDAERWSGDPGASVAVGSGGSVPCGALAGVHPFIRGRVRFQTNNLPRLGLCIAGDYGLPLHHPWFIEWIRVSQLADLIEISGAKPLRLPFTNSVMWGSCRQTWMSWTNMHYGSRRLRPGWLEFAWDPVNFQRRMLRPAPSGLGSTAPRYKWELWGCGVHPWIRCGSIRRTITCCVIGYCKYCTCFLIVSFSLVASLYGVYLSSS